VSPTPRIVLKRESVKREAAAQLIRACTHKIRRVGFTRKRTSPGHTTARPFRATKTIRCQAHTYTECHLHDCGGLFMQSPMHSPVAA
jgi:hypothetical protein